MWPSWRVKMPTQNLLRLLLLLMLMPRYVLTIVWCRFRSWSLVIQSNFCLDFEHKVWSKFWTWSSGKILRLKSSQYFAADPCLRLWRVFLVEIMKLRLVKILKFKFNGYADIWLRFRSSCLVEIMKMKSDQDLFENLCYDKKKLLWYKQNWTLGSVVPLAMFCLYF